MTVLIDDADLTQEFVSESMDMLDMVEPQLLEMSKNIDAETFDKEIVDSIFRLFHTLKGSAGFMNLSVVQNVSHEAENLLDLVRNGYKLSEEHVELLIRTTDFIRELMEKIEVENSDEMAKEEGENLVAELVNAVKEVDGRGAAGSNFTEAPPTPTTAEGNDASDSKIFNKPSNLYTQFATEALELMERTEQRIFEMKENPDHQTVLQDLFRIIHTFKGNCGFMGFGNMEKLSHAMESVVEQFQMGKMAVTEGHLDLLLSMQGILEKALAEPSDVGSPDIANIDIYLDIIRDTLKRSGVNLEDQAKVPLQLVDAPGAAEAVKSDNPPVAVSQAEASTSEAAPTGDAVTPKVVSFGEANGSDKTPGPSETGQPGDENPNIQQPSQEPSIQSEGKVDPSIIPQQEYGRRKSDQDLTARPEYGRRRTDQLDSVPGKHPIRQDIRVNIEKLDSLFDLVGELIIAESMVTHNPEIEEHEFPSFEKAANHLTKITRELHDISMLVRMIPVSGTFQKMNRLVHDLSRKSGKAVDLELIGEDTEVDKTVVELISDPLIHLIRNSVDHGLEPAEARLAAGKPTNGKITIEARHEGNEVWILVADDGRGLDREKLLEKGRERGLVTGEGTDMKDEEVFNLIFEPGLSTAKEVTNVSGRGVGMDVVKRNIEKIKGRVEVHSEKGVGTRFIIRIPLTLAIIEGMLVRVGASDYTVPILSIKETIRVFPKQVTTTAEGQEFVKIREHIFPVLRLHELHRLQTSITKLEHGVLLVLEHQRQIFCLFVDQLVGLHQTVVKGLTGFLSDVRGISGYTILGNGDVSLILDLGSLLAIAATPENQAIN